MIKNSHFKLFQSNVNLNFSRSVQSKAKSNEWIYGFNPVKSVLSKNLKNRQFERLLLVEDFPSERRLSKEVTMSRSKRSEVKQLAIDQKITIEYCSKIAINNFTEGNPNQGILLEASKLNLRLLHSLGKVEDNSKYIGQFSSKAGDHIELKSGQRPPIWLVLNNITDPHNVGSIIRSSYFFGIDGIILDENNTPSLNSTISKSSSGALDLMDIYFTTNLKKFLKNSKSMGWKVIGTGMHPNKESVSLDQVTELNKGGTLIVMGSEGQGIQDNLISSLDTMVHIPFGNEDGDSDLVDSLNVGVATGVILSQFSVKK